MKKTLLLIISLFSAGTVSAQEKYFYINLDVNTPLSNTRWLDNTSAKGAKLGYRVFINPRISAGIDFGWTTFDQYFPTETVYNPTGAVTTDYFRYVYNYSITGSGQYYFPVGESERFFPYAGLGLGANNNEYVVFYNIYSDAQRSWGFVARPEAGILMRLGPRKSIGVMAAIHYDYSTNKSDDFGYNNFSTIGFQVGIMFLDW